MIFLVCNRILVDLPSLENREKILRVILGQEELAEGFSIDELARMTNGYSGSDLKVCTGTSHLKVLIYQLSTD